MFFTITLTHFTLLALNRLFAICVPQQPCLVSKRAFIIKSLLGYGVPTFSYLLSNFLHGLEGSEIFYSRVLEACVHVTEDIDYVIGKAIYQFWGYFTHIFIAFNGSS